MKRARWSPSLHPRAADGKFKSKGGNTAAARAARKAGNAPADARQARIRKASYAANAASGAVSAGVGVTAVVSGYTTRSPKRTAAGVARIASAGAETAYGIRSARRLTSKAFHAQTPAQKRREIRKNTGKSLAIGYASGIANVAILGTHPMGSMNRNAIKARHSTDKLGRVAKKVGAPASFARAAQRSTKNRGAPNMAKATRAFRYSSAKKRSATLDRKYRDVHVSVRADQRLFSQPDPFKAVDLRRRSTGARRNTRPTRRRKS